MQHSKTGAWSWLTAVLLGLIGLYLFLGGAYLLILGGSLFYVLAGLVLLAVVASGFRAPRTAMRLYAGLLLVATIWSVVESGFDIWGLEVRLLTLVGIGAWLLIPGVWRTGAGWLSDKREVLGSLAVAGIVLVIGACTSHSIEGTVPADRMAAATPDLHDDQPAGDWRYYGRNAQGERYTPLAQITPANIGKLKRAWVTETGDTQQAGEAVVAGPDAGHEFNLELTPIKVGDTLYMCTPHSWVMAMDAATGKIKWKYDPHPAKADLDTNVYLACRGVSYYRIPDEIQTSCRERIYSPVADARIVAVNAQTGQPCDDFGDHGFISMREYMGNVPLGFHFITSPRWS